MYFSQWIQCFAVLLPESAHGPEGGRIYTACPGMLHCRHNGRVIESGRSKRRGPRTNMAVSGGLEQCRFAQQPNWLREIQKNGHGAIRSIHSSEVVSPIWARPSRSAILIRMSPTPQAHMRIVAAAKQLFFALGQRRLDLLTMAMASTSSGVVAGSSMTRRRVNVLAGT